MAKHQMQNVKTKIKTFYSSISVMTSETAAESCVQIHFFKECTSALLSPVHKYVNTQFQLQR